MDGAYLLVAPLMSQPLACPTQRSLTAGNMVSFLLMVANLMQEAEIAWIGNVKRQISYPLSGKSHYHSCMKKAVNIAEEVKKY